jgi:ABC-type transport system substrate-binding protein
MATTEVNYDAFQANEVDATTIPTPDIKRERGTPGFFQIPSLLIYYLTPNMVQPPFNNVHCARAIAYAINEDAINRQILYGSSFTVQSPVPNGLPGYFDSPTIPHYDPARARAEYQKCPGGIHGVQLTYAHTSTDLDNVYGAAIPAMWSAVGIHITPKPVTFNDWINVVSQPMPKSHTLLTENNDGGLPDPWNFATVNLHQGGIYNIGDYNNPTVNRLFDAADVTANPKRRAALYIKGETIALNQGAMIPIGQSYGFALVKPWVHGFVGGVAFGLLEPRNNDWANVSISPH